MASSPLEVYEKAYRLHYDDNDIAKACEIYKQIIAEFPESNESGYSAIQIQKIQAEDLVRKLDKSKAPLLITGVVVAVVMLASLVACGVLGYLFYKQTQTENHKNALVSQALGLMYLGRDTDALKMLEDAKAAPSRDISPYALSADVHLRRGNLQAARAEYDAYNKKFGLRTDAPPIDSRPAASSPAASVVQPPSDTATTPADGEDERKQPTGTRLADKNSVIKFLDSISGAQ